MKTYVPNVCHVRRSITHQVRQGVEECLVVCCNLLEIWTGIKRWSRLRKWLVKANINNIISAPKEMRDWGLTGQPTHPSNEISSRGSTAVTMCIEHYVDSELGVPCALTGNILISAQRSSNRGPIGQCNTRHITLAQWRPHSLGQRHSRIVDDVPFITCIGFEDGLSPRKDSQERIWSGGDVREGRGIEIGFPEELTQLVFFDLSARSAAKAVRGVLVPCRDRDQNVDIIRKSSYRRWGAHLKMAVRRWQMSR